MADRLVEAIAIDVCVATAAESGGTMSCEDEGECPARDVCGHWAAALAVVAELQRRQDTWEAGR